MIGPRIGVAVGPYVGLAVGVSEDATSGGGGGSGMALVTRDATSGIYCPASAAEWTITLAQAGILSGNPSALHLMQDASGNPADAIGTFTLTATGTGITYQQAVAGWSRKAINMTSGTTGLLQSTAGGLPNISTTSMLSLIYAKVTTTASTRDVALIGAVATRGMMKTLLTSGFAQGLFVGNTSNGVADAGGAVRPWTIQVNRTASSNTAFTDVDKLAPAFAGTLAGQSISIGNAVSGTATAQYLYAAHFFAGAAELTAAQLKTLLQTLGFTVTWT